MCFANSRGRHLCGQRFRNLPDDGAIWPERGVKGCQCPLGPPDPAVAEVELGQPLRLVRIEQQLWERVLNPALEGSVPRSFLSGFMG